MSDRDERFDPNRAETPFEDDPVREIAAAIASGDPLEVMRVHRTWPASSAVRHLWTANALAKYADPRHWGIERESFGYPRAVWIGPGANQRFPDAPGIARAALEADVSGEHG